jgi:hypothetical protein
MSWPRKLFFTRSSVSGKLHGVQSGTTSQVYRSRRVGWGDAWIATGSLFNGATSL